MKAVMYHYVRPGEDDLPFFRYLHRDSFREQLSYFQAEGAFVSRDGFLEAATKRDRTPRGVLLTCDDGFRDHFDHVLPELEKRGLFGLFFIPTGVYRKKKALDVHRVHYLLGMRGGSTLLAELRGFLEPEMLSDEHVEEFRTLTYATQDNDADTTLFKRILNYFISYEWREKVIDRLVETFFDDEALHARLYMTEAELREMHDRGMILGSHGVNHFLFSKLSPEEQRAEIAESFAFLENLTGGLEVRSFCYPYGGHYSFTPETERILDEERTALSFNVESRDVSLADLKSRPQALPRYDCNEFPHGAADMGPRRNREGTP